MSGKILRFVSGRETMSNPVEFQPTERFLKGDTELDLATAEKAFDAWYEKFNENASPEASNAAFDAIWSYISALSQFYHENGVRWGIRFMLEAMSGTKSLDEVKKMML